MAASKAMRTVTAAPDPVVMHPSRRRPTHPEAGPVAALPVPVSACPSTVRRGA
ncbi:MAG TPA: hypothetical protein VIN65_08825 [Candidatus Dormibacteraeota bacterium]